MLLNPSASAPANSSDHVHVVEEETEGAHEPEGVDGVEDLVIKPDVRVKDIDDLAIHAAEPPDEPDGTDDPQDVGATRARVTGAGKEVLFEEASGEQGRKPQGLRSPTAPTREEYETHVLTHIPYRSWCWHCVSSRRPNTAHHLSRRKAHRKIPLMTIDYFFIRDSHDRFTVPCVSALVVPFKVGVAFQVDAKGEDEHAIRRLSDFLIRVGMHRFHYVIKSDQEWPLEALVQKAAAMADRKGTRIPEDVPLEAECTAVTPTEHSAVAESSSNGLIERFVQSIEGQLRTLKSALETRIGARIPNTHPVLAWAIEYSAVLVSKYHVGEDNRTGYSRLHGQECSEALAEFGELVLYHVPAKFRKKLDPRWKYGVFLGRSLSSDEAFVGTRGGHVVRARALARLIPSVRWDKDWVQSVRGGTEQHDRRRHC